MTENRIEENNGVGIFIGTANKSKVIYINKIF
ncbi:MAG: hypothetical protein ACK52J_05615 [bacterium]